MIKNTVNSSKLASKIFLIIGIVFLVIAICFNIYDIKVKSNWDLEKATITNINHYEETIKISYSYNNEYFEVVTSFYSSIFDEGDEVVIYVNPTNPSECYMLETFTIAIVFYCVGGPFTIIGFALFIVGKKRDKVINDCLNYGYKKTLEVKEIKRSYTYNKGKTYFYLVVETEGKELKSDLFTIECSKSNERYLVDVYFLENGKYYIKLDSCRVKEIIEY